MAKATDIRKGMVIRIDDELWVVAEMVHVTPGKGRACVQCKMRSIQKGNTVGKRFRSMDQVDDVFIESKLMEYLYNDGDNYIFMDVQTSEQVMIPMDLIADVVPYLAYNTQLKMAFCEGQFVNADLPATVALEVVETEPAARGDTVSNVTKPATLETGLTVRVPAHINIGDKLKIDTRTGEFQGRE